MRIIKIANNYKRLEQVKKLLEEVCEDLKKEGISSDAPSVRLEEFLPLG